MTRPYRRLAIVSVTGLAMLGTLGALPENSVLRNTSLSMDLGWYVMVPFAEPKVGDVVAFDVPPQARDLAEAACIRGSLLKRVIYRHPNGDLYLAGDHGGARSFDSRYYGAVPETAIMGVYKLVVESNPETGEGTQDKALRSEGSGCGGHSGKRYSQLTVPESLPETFRSLPERFPETPKW